MRAGWRAAFGECAQRRVPRDAFGALPRVPAVAGVDVHRVLTGQAALDQPVRCGRAGRDAVLALRFPPFLGSDPPVDLGELLFSDAACEVQHLQTGRRVIVHLFDSRVGCPSAVTLSGCPVSSDLECVPSNLDGRESVSPKIERWGPGALRRAADVVRHDGRVYLTGPSSSPGCASGMSRMASRVYCGLSGGGATPGAMSTVRSLLGSSVDSARPRVCTMRRAQSRMD